MAISTNSYSEHLRRLKFVLQRLEWVNLQLSPSKTRLMAKSITFLGKTLSSKGIEIDESKIKAILELPSPKNVKHLKKMLGMLNYHRSFIHKFAEKAATMYKLLRKGVKFHWDTDCVLGFVDYSDKYQ